eukprot:934956-Amphidinium_carterae.1
MPQLHTPVAHHASDCLKLWAQAANYEASELCRTRSLRRTCCMKACSWLRWPTILPPKCSGKSPEFTTHLTEPDPRDLVVSFKNPTTISYQKLAYAVECTQTHDHGNKPRQGVIP